MKLTRKEYTDPAEKKKDFWLGVGLWFALNIGMFLLLGGLNIALLSGASALGDSIGTDLSGVANIISLILNFIPFVVNIGLIIYFALTRGQIALGMLVGLGIGLAIVICLGMIFMAACFIMLGSYNGGL